MGSCSSHQLSIDQHKHLRELPGARKRTTWMEQREPSLVQDQTGPGMACVPTSQGGQHCNSWGIGFLASVEGEKLTLDQTPL